MVDISPSIAASRPQHSRALNQQVDERERETACVCKCVVRVSLKGSKNQHGRINSPGSVCQPALFICEPKDDSNMFSPPSRERENNIIYIER